jgi:hypothetical protein
MPCSSIECGLLPYYTALQPSRSVLIVSAVRILKFTMLILIIIVVVVLASGIGGRPITKFYLPRCWCIVVDMCANTDKFTYHVVEPIFNFPEGDLKEELQCSGRDDHGRLGIPAIRPDERTKPLVDPPTVRLHYYSADCSNAVRETWQDFLRFWVLIFVPITAMQASTYFLGQFLRPVKIAG